VPPFDLRRIKHLTVIGRDRDAITRRYRDVFDFGDAKPGVMERYGLINDHVPIGDSFLEVLEPTDPDRPGGRFLARHGEGFYMLIFEIGGQPQAVVHLEAMGARITARSDRGEYRNIHLHPSTNLGPLLGLGDPVGPNPWWPGGPDWQQHRRHTVVRMVREVALVTDDLDRLAGRYLRYFGIEPRRFERRADGGLAAWAPVGDTVLHYVQPAADGGSAAARHLAAHGPGIFEARVEVHDLDAALARAAAAGVAAGERCERSGVRSALLDPGAMFGARWWMVEAPGGYPPLGIDPTE
jgi:hypothetical protein